LKVTQGAAPGTEATLDVEALEMLGRDMPSLSLPLKEVVGIKLVDLLSKNNLQSSKSEARRLIQNGGVYINNIKINDENYVVEQEHIIDGKLMLLALGKKNKLLIRIVESPS
jgi:tyrosyl-tRNA synthetase